MTDPNHHRPPSAAATETWTETWTETRTETRTETQAARVEARLRRLTHPARPAQVITRRAIAGDAPLSPAQERIYFLQWLEPASPAYREVRAFRLTGPLDVAALERSLLALVERHEILRTSFHSNGGRTAQRIGSPPPDVTLAPVDLSTLDPAEREAAIARHAAAEARKPYDLASGPILRPLLLRLGAQEHVLLLTLHHLVCDGWSVRVLRRELAACYAAYTAGRAPELPALPIQFADYAAWQAARLARETLPRSLDYWKDALAGVPSVLELPTDHPRPEWQTSAGATASTTISAPLLTQLKALAQQEGCTLFMALVAVVQTLLYRYTGQHEFLVGVPVAGRALPETEGLVGHFVNTLPLRGDLSGSPSFRTLLRRVRTTALAAYAHQEVPFDKLVEELAPPRDPSRPPLVQVGFQLRNLPTAPEGAGPLRIEELRVDTGVAKMDLSLEAIELADGLGCLCEYNRDLFEPATIARLLGHFRVLLEGCVATPDLPVVTLALLSEDEYRQQLVEWNETATPYPRERCLHELIEAQVERTPNALAVRDARTALTYRELNASANQLAHELRALGVGPESLVAVYLPRSTAMIVAMLGILKTGGAYLPLDPAYPAERLRLVLGDARAQVVVTDSSLLPRLPDPSELPEHLGQSTQIICLARNYNVRTRSTENPDHVATPVNRAYVIYTSGSTGTPKGVEIAHRNVVNLVSLDLCDLPMSVADRASQVAGPSFDVSVWEIWQPLARGASLHLPPDHVRLDAARLRDWLLHERISFAFVPTVLAERLLALPWPSRTPLRVLLTGGEALTRHPRPHLPFALVNGYGPTETTVWATACVVPPQEHAEYAPSIGRPIANVRAYVLDGERRPVPIGVPGQLYIAGAGVARGYLARPDLTAECFIQEPFSWDPDARAYATGDWVRYHADGSLHFLGRSDRQVKIRGFRIELGEIEATLKAHPDVAAATVVCRARNDLNTHDPNAQGDRMLVAYVVPTAGTHPSSDDLRRFLAERLPDYMLPVIVRLDELPLNPSGKVDQQALPDWELGESGGAARDAPMTPSTTPSTTLERQLVRIWERVLGRSAVDSPIGVRDDFFALGGHSLLAAQLFAEMERHLGMRLPLALLFRAPTVERLAALILAGNWLEEQWAVADSTLVPIQLDGARPPLFCLGGAQGEVLNYITLAYHLSKDQPVYGLQARGLDGTAEPFATVEEMARQYVAQIRTVQPDGPYYLAGYSAGGTVAFEVAQQLRQQGQQIALLAMFDNLANNVARYPLDLPAVVAYARQLLLDLSPWLAAGVAAYLRASPDERVIRLRAWARRTRKRLLRLGEQLGIEVARLRARSSRDATRAGPGYLQVRREHVGYGFWKQPEGLPEHRQRVWDAYVNAVLTYMPQPYAGRITFFRCQTQDALRWCGPTKGWDRVAPETETYHVSGAHNDLWAEPHISVLAEQLEACLLRAQTLGSEQPALPAPTEVADAVPG